MLLSVLAYHMPILSQAAATLGPAATATVALLILVESHLFSLILAVGVVMRSARLQRVLTRLHLSQCHVIRSQ